MKKGLMLMMILCFLLVSASCEAPADEPEPDKAAVEDSKINEGPARPEPIDRETKIPDGKVKMTPGDDLLPPILHSDEFEEPVPMPYPINTAGAEDSGFMMPDGETFYVWFTPDPLAPLGNQLDDGVTGVYVSRKADGIWQKPERILLQKPDEQALDGCEFIKGDTMWFCSARTGYTGLHWFTARFQDGRWQDWQDADFDPEYEVGELHITADDRELYFHSPRDGGLGSYDIWVSENIDGVWQEPLNIESVNSPEMDGWPSLNEAGDELWFTRFYLGSPAIFRSKRVDGKWLEPELIISQFAGESSIDNDGNIYFTHHFYKDGVMLEADIYVAYRKQL